MSLFDVDDAPQLVSEYVGLRKQAELLDDRVSDIRKKLIDIVESNGYVDDKGSLFLELPEEIQGVAVIKRERRVSQFLDVSTAEEILKAKGLYDRCVTFVPQINQDAIEAAYWEDLLDEHDIDNMFQKKVSWALVVKQKLTTTS